MTLARAILIIPAVAGALLFAGCTSTPAPGADTKAGPSANAESDAAASGDQSVAEACAILEEGMSDFIPLMQEPDLLGATAADREGMLVRWQAAESTFTAAVAEVSNPDVRAAADDAGNAMTDLVSFMEGGAGADLDTAAIMPIVQTLGTEFTALGETCS